MTWKAKPFPQHSLVKPAIGSSKWMYSSAKASRLRA